MSNHIDDRSQSRTAPNRRQHVTEHFSASGEHYRLIFEAAAIGLALSTLDGVLRETNRALQEMLGYSAEELDGMAIGQFTHPDDLLKQGPVHAELAAGLREHYRIEKRYIRKDGRVVWGRLTESLARDAGGRPYFTIAMVEDITERVQAYELLEQRVRERTHELSTLLEVSSDVASILELRPLLGLILDQLKKIVDYHGCSIMIVDGDDLALVDSRGPVPEEERSRIRFPLRRAQEIWDFMRRGQPVITGDVHGDTAMARAFRAAAGDLMGTVFTRSRCWMAVPLLVKERAIGLLHLASLEPDFYQPRDAELALAIANHAAVAIENARLYERAQETAVLEERQRLARELHDSVSQALYGIALGAQTARTLLDRDPAQVAGPLDYVIAQTAAGIAEMRALIFELRPEALEREGLVVALEKQAAALRARYGLAVSMAVDGEPDVPFIVKEALYRIMQEALHNTVKHARATSVELALRRDGDTIMLTISDDGCGFDPQAPFPGHLGLRTMRERAERLRGMLTIDSAPGAGTLVCAAIPVERR